MTITLENVNNSIYEVIKSLIKLDNNIVIKKYDYGFDDLNSETKDIIHKNMSGNEDGVLLKNYDDIKKFIMDEI